MTDRIFMVPDELIDARMCCGAGQPDRMVKTDHSTERARVKDGMLNEEYSLFLNILSDHLAGGKTGLPENAGSPVRLARAQQVAAIVYQQTRLPELLRDAVAVGYYAVRREKLLREIHEGFEAAGIPYLIVKGNEVARYYPEPALRQMGDTDILVHAGDKEKAGEVLERIGMVKDTGKPDMNDWDYRKDDLEVELHHRLLYDNESGDERLKAYADLAWEHAEAVDGPYHRLTPAFHFVFLILHIRKHLMHRGIGIRQFMDLAVMMKSAPVDWDEAEQDLERLGLLPFAGRCAALVRRWFGITCPIDRVAITDDFYERATEAILTDGVFGSSSPDNGVILSLREKGRCRATLQYLFPPMSEMKGRYPGMGRYPVLLPLLWVRRVADSVRYKRADKGIRRASRHVMIKDGDIRKREDALGEWGLL